MSSNYYVNTTDGREIHLGKWATAGFTFRAATDCEEPNAYAAWLAQLDLGVIVSESGYDLTRDEMIEHANEQVPAIRRSIKLSDVRRSGHHFVQEGRLFSTSDFS